MKLRKLLMPLVVATAIFMSGCSIVIGEAEISDEDEGNGVLIVDEVIEDEDETSDETDAIDETEEEIANDEIFDEITEVVVTDDDEIEVTLDRDASYTSADDVALYLYTYHELPVNFITKNEARDLGWEGGSLEPYASGMCIGGDRFGNYEGVLPEGYSYLECDIDTLGANSRGARRLVFTNDYEYIYYTEDHYETFTLLYGEE